MSVAQSRRDIYTVSRLNAEARMMLTQGFPPLWISGELSNLSKPASGHIYFTLKDTNAQIRCAMFRNRNVRLRFAPKDGMQVLLYARVSLFEARGEFQLAVEHMEEAGHGDLQRRFERQKQKLAAEGLFDEARKKALPAFPRRLGVITSPSGAAVRDVLSVLRRRYPVLPVVIYGVTVQGEGAAAKIAAALREASLGRDCDVLILTRGGGSLEDLWAFNEESVARAIAACEVPVVCGVGHEIDFTIADFCADVRAPTPSAAAEIVSPDQEELLTQIGQYEHSLQGRLRERITTETRKLDWLHGRLRRQHPRNRLQQKAQRVDDLEQRLMFAQRVISHALNARLCALSTRLQQHSPRMMLTRTAARRDRLEQRLISTVTQSLTQRRHRLESLARSLNTVSPLATLGRGFALVTRSDDGVLVRSSAQTRAGDDIDVRLAKGRLSAKVERTR
ncbi:MAG: exodeoxyribonuclease VII large subunit [Gammaproteobacteria bacterium]